MTAERAPTPWQRGLEIANRAPLSTHDVPILAYAIKSAIEQAVAAERKRCEYAVETLLLGGDPNRVLCADTLDAALTAIRSGEK